MKVCIFDLDGTLTDTLTAISHFGNTALAAHGFKTFPKDSYRGFVGDGRRKLIERMLAAQGQLNEENYEMVCKTYDACYESDPLYKTDAYNGIRELLRELRLRGARLAVCSNKPDNVVRGVVSKVFPGETFDCVRGVIDGGATKPDPQCALSIARSIGAAPEECLFIGDTNVDIFTAKNAGMKSIGVLWGFRGADELVEAGADYIVERPSEILQFCGK